MRCKLTVSLDKKLIDKLEETRNMETKHPRITDDKSHFTEKILTIGLSAYIKKQKFFDTINLNNVDLSKINF